jgi:hypothetical protein
MWMECGSGVLGNGMDCTMQPYGEPLQMNDSMMVDVK